MALNNLKLGASSLQNISTGDKNIVIGDGSGIGLTTESNNVYIGNAVNPTPASNQFLVQNNGTTLLSGDFSAGTISIAGATTTSSYIDMTEISVPSDPSTGFGRLYALTDGSLHFINDASTDTDLTGGGASPVETYEFTATDSSFAIPSGAKTMDIVICGGGGGAGNGTTDEPGGGGGSAATLFLYSIPVLNDTSLSISIGLGGSNGFHGSSGGNSSITFNNTSRVWYAYGGGAGITASYLDGGGSAGGGSAGSGGAGSAGSGVTGGSAGSSSAQRIIGSLAGRTGGNTKSNGSGYPVTQEFNHICVGGSGGGSDQGFTGAGGDSMNGIVGGAYGTASGCGGGGGSSGLGKGGDAAEYNNTGGTGGFGAGGGGGGSGSSGLGGAGGGGVCYLTIYIP